MNDFTSTPFTRQFKKDCEALVKLRHADRSAVAETHRNAPDNASLVSGATSAPTPPPVESN